MSTTDPSAKRHEGQRTEDEAVKKERTEGGPESVAETFERCGRAREAVVRRCGRQRRLRPEDLEDARQELDLTVWEVLARLDAPHPQLPAPDNPAAYAMKAGSNHLSNWVRDRDHTEGHQERSKEVDAILENGTDRAPEQVPAYGVLRRQAPDPREEAVRHEIRARVRQACNELEGEERRLAELWLEQKSLAQIAKELNLTETQMRHLWERVKEKLRIRLRGLIDA
jgi:RNA polymerase sigma factor (sigma-70 family)